MCSLIVSGMHSVYPPTRPRIMFLLDDILGRSDVSSSIPFWKNVTEDHKL